MKVAEKLFAKRFLSANPPVTIAFLGDSVTQGCFECYFNENDGLETVFDYNNAFATRVREILNLLYPYAQINIINSGISGGSAPGGSLRLERDVLCYHPDLTVVSFGLNDCCNPDISLEIYTESLRDIFTRLRRENSEVIFLTQNYMNTKSSRRIQGDELYQLCMPHMEKQNSGELKRYMLAAAEVAAECGAEVCDLYHVWEQLAQYGVDTTNLLANRINHPIREFHYYMAIRLVEKILGVN